MFLPEFAQKFLTRQIVVWNFPKGEFSRVVDLGHVEADVHHVLQICDRVYHNLCNFTHTEKALVIITMALQARTTFELAEDLKSIDAAWAAPKLCDVPSCMSWTFVTKDTVALW